MPAVLQRLTCGFKMQFGRLMKSHFAMGADESTGGFQDGD